MRTFLSVAALSAAAALLGAGSASAQFKPYTAGMATQPVTVQARPIATFSKNGSPAPGGKLEWRGGLVLTSDSENFGGWSGLVLSEDGASLVAISDSGTWMTGELAYDGDRPKGVNSARIGALLARKGKPLSNGGTRDAEAIALADGTVAKGTAYISFEQKNRIGVFPLNEDGLGAPSTYMQMPKETRSMRKDGIEAITVLRGGAGKGALVAFAENALPGDKEHRGWIWVDGTPRGFTVPGIGDYGVTDAVSLEDGSVLILERRFRWSDGVKIRLRHLAAKGIKAGGTAAGEVLLDADNSKEIDNLEALALSKGAHGETVVTLMSDDNFNHFLQRTVLLQFTLNGEPATKSAEDTQPAADAKKP